MRIAVVDTGVANLASVTAALSRLGAPATRTAAPSDVRTADGVVLPGVGAFATAVARLSDAGLARPLGERISAGRPTLAVCLGLQLLAEGSDESPGVPGLGLVPGTATRFPDAVRVPHLGWNRVGAAPGARLLCDGWAYFANSYRLTEPPPGWSCATAEHGGSFVAGLERGPVLACQFHPELSGAWGEALLGRWLATAWGASC
jgi:imidazole glycerol phosphate synthase glutamine amidotransferase subunit